MTHSLSDPSEFHAALPDRRLRQLYAWWRRAAAGRPLPARSDIDPMEIPFALSRLALIDIAPDDLTPRWRLVGTVLTDRMGAELRGQRLENLATDPVRAGLRDQAEIAALWRRPLFSLYGCKDEHGATRQAARLLLPLSDNGRVTDCMILCATDPHPPLGADRVLLARGPAEALEADCIPRRQAAAM